MSDQVVKIVHTPANAGVSVKLHRSVQGTSLEVDVTRLKAENESYDFVALEAARLMAVAYHEAARLAVASGLTLGKEQGSAPAPRATVAAGEARRQIE
jgi:hypothetical protein